MHNLMRTIAVSALIACGICSAAAADEAPPGHKVGYVLTTYNWATYATKEKSECPNGFNDGPRQHYDTLFPRDGTKRKLVDTELKREAAIWFPAAGPEAFEFKEPVSKTAPGMNLDGKVGPNDFTSPDGEKGIDNQFYRVIGCIDDLRPGGSLYVFNNMFMRANNYARFVIELTNVDSLLNDDDVTVTTYRGLDLMLSDATGESFSPYGTQRVDIRGGKPFIKSFHGKIANGVLTTDTGAANFPYTNLYSNRTFIQIRDARFRLNVLPDQATGMIGGYFDIVSYHRSLVEAVSTNTLDYGKHDASSVFRALSRLADAHPDPKTGKNTAISAAIEVKFKQVFVEHPNQVIGSKGESATPQQVAQSASR